MSRQGHQRSNGLGVTKAGASKHTFSVCFAQVCGRSVFLLIYILSGAAGGLTHHLMGSTGTYILGSSGATVFMCLCVCVLLSVCAQCMCCMQACLNSQVTALGIASFDLDGTCLAFLLFRQRCKRKLVAAHCPTCHCRLYCWLVCGLCGVQVEESGHRWLHRCGAWLDRLLKGRLHAYNSVLGDFMRKWTKGVQS